MDRVNRRMHNKVFIADNTLAFTGGRNLGDAYFLASDKANFVDIDMVVAGPATRALSTVFDRYWNSPLAFPVHALVSKSDAAASSADPKQLDTAPPAEPTFGLPPDAVARQLAPGGGMKLTWAPTRLLADDPAKIETQGEANPDQLMFDDVSSLMRSARQELVVISPYLVPGKRGLELLADLRRRGLAVRGLTSGLASTDAPAVHVGYARYRLPMLKAGVELYEMRARLDAPDPKLSGFGRSAARLHAKVLVVDRRWLLVGSMNLDPRSVSLNSEQGLLINSPALAAEVLRFFDEMTHRGSYRVELDGDGKLRWTGEKPGGGQDRADTEPDTSVWRRLGWRLMSPFAPEEML
jgi:phosphatidylserine/phosphatidylglycerophosphate/cardiolipin synthase-like enzyme